MILRLVQTYIYSTLRFLPQPQKEARGQMERMQPRPRNLGQESGQACYTELCIAGMVRRHLELPGGSDMNMRWPLQARQESFPG